MSTHSITFDKADKPIRSVGLRSTIGFLTTERNHRCPRQRPWPTARGNPACRRKLPRLYANTNSREPHLVAHKVVTGQSGPFDSVFTFLDPLDRKSVV